MQIIESIPDGKRRVQIGLHLRQSWFINSMFVNVEVWHNVLKKDIDTLIDLDKYLMKKILDVHSKAPIEALYLETSAIPLNYILAGRRINYLHNIYCLEMIVNLLKEYILHKKKVLKKETGLICFKMIWPCSHLA